MPTLEEYLGGLTESLCSARQMADLQSVRLAEAYAQHELLRHLSIPRMRFDSVEMTVPVAIASTEEGVASPGEAETMRNALLQALAPPLGHSTPTDAMQSAIGPIIDEWLATLTSGAEALLAQIRKFADKLTERIEQLVGSGDLAIRGERDLDAALIRRTIVASLRENLPFDPPGKQLSGNVEVIAESHKLREFRPNDLVIIKVVVNEEGLEWSQYETDTGHLERKLIPE